MTVETSSTNHSADQEILAELEVTFDRYRGQIASLSIEACGAFTEMFLPLSPFDDAVIDIDAIEWEQLELEVVTAERPALLSLTA